MEVVEDGEGGWRGRWRMVREVVEEDGEGGGGGW